jgi:hypothetical protein
MATRDELVVALIERYARGGRLERGRILDEFAAVTGFHRNTRCGCCEEDPLVNNRHHVPVAASMTMRREMAHRMVFGCGLN